MAKKEEIIIEIEPADSGWEPADTGHEEAVEVIILDENERKKGDTIPFAGDNLLNGGSPLDRMAAYGEYHQKRNDREYVVSGSVLSCSYGMNLTRIGLPTDHGIYDESGQAVLTCKDCVAHENIYSFGICYSPEVLKKQHRIVTLHKGIHYANNQMETGPACKMWLTGEWLEGDVHTHIWNAKTGQYEKALMEDALIPCMYGEGIIRIVEVNHTVPTTQESYFCILDQYLKGNISDEEAISALENIAGEQKLDAYVPSKEMEESYSKRNLQRYDKLIIGWCEYYDDRLNVDINKAYIKAMMWIESNIGYSSSTSPNKNAQSDVMQTLDPRNPTIYEFCTYTDIDTSKNVKVVGVGGTKGDEANYVLPVTLDSKHNHRKTRTKHNTPVADRLFERKGGYYYYQYQKATPVLSTALGIKNYCIKLEEAAGGDPLLAVEAYNGNSTHKEAYRKKVEKIVAAKGVDIDHYE